MFAGKLTIADALLDESIMTARDWTDEQIRECTRIQRQREQELAKAASAGLFLTAADLRDE